MRAGREVQRQVPKRSGDAGMPPSPLPVQALTTALGLAPRDLDAGAPTSRFTMPSVLAQRFHKTQCAIIRSACGSSYRKTQSLLLSWPLSPGASTEKSVSRRRNVQYTWQNGGHGQSLMSYATVRWNLRFLFYNYGNRR